MSTYKLINITNSSLLTLDIEDLWAAAYKWHIDTQGAYTQLPSGFKVYLSHLILNGLNSPRVIYGLQVMHANSDIYDYQRHNLVATQYTPTQQARSKQGIKSGYRGVSWCGQRNKWCTQYSYGGQRVHRSFHDNELNAALTYNSVVLEYEGPKSRKLNQIDTWSADYHH